MAGFILRAYNLTASRVFSRQRNCNGSKAFGGVRNNFADSEQSVASTAMLLRAYLIRRKRFSERQGEIKVENVHVHHVLGH